MVWVHAPRQVEYLRTEWAQFRLMFACSHQGFDVEGARPPARGHEDMVAGQQAPGFLYQVRKTSMWPRSWANFRFL